MSSPFRPAILRLLLTSVLCIQSSTTTMRAQSVLKAEYQDEFLPVVNMIGGTKYVEKDGKTREAGYTQASLFAADSFGDGWIEATTERVEDRQKKKSGSATKDAYNDYFYYEAVLTPDRNLKKCIAVLTFGLGGTPSVYVESIGSLRSGKPTKLKLKIGSSQDTIGRLHIFSEGKEIRSTLVPDAYDVLRDEYAAFRAQPNGVPISILFARQVSYPNRLSPSGRYLATFRDDGKTNRILVYDLLSGEKAKEIELGEYDESIYSLNWVNEDEFVFVMDNKLRRGRRDSDDVEVLAKGVDWISSMLRAEPDKLLLSSVKSKTFILFDLKEGKQELKTNIGEFDFVWWDRSGIARIKRVDTGDDVRFFHRFSPSEKWRPIDELVKQEGLRFDFSGANALEQQVFIDSFAADQNTLYVYYNDDGATNKFAEFSLTEGRVTRTLLASKTYDLGGLDYIPEAAILRRDSDQQVVGVQYSTDKPKVKWYHPDFAYVQELFDTLHPDTVNLPVDWTDDGTTMVFRCFNEKHPGKYYAFKPLEQKMILLLDRLPQIKDFQLGEMRPIRYQARDGYTIHGYLTTPPGYDGQKRLPAVVLPHGGPWVRDIWGFDEWAQFFATRGYAVFQPNYRGSVGYGMPHVQAGIGNVDTVMIDDIADGTRHFLDEGVFDPANIFIFGHSYGGYAAYMGMIRYPELYKAGVSVSGVSHYGEQIKHRKSAGRYAYEFWKAALGSHKDRELVERVSPYFRASEIKGPIRIYHGKWDGVVPVEQSELMEKALKNTGVDYTVTYFDYEGHSFRYMQNISRYMSETETFFRENLTNANEPPSRESATTP